MKNNRTKSLPAGAKTAIKWTVYTLAPFIMFAFMTSGSPEASKAITLIPFGVAVACFSGEIPSALIGALCGVLADISLGQLVGFTGLYLCIFCGLCSALFRQFLRKNIINYLIAVIIACSVYLYIDYFFFYRIWEFEGYFSVFLSRLLPAYFKTLGWSLVIYPAVMLTEKLCGFKRSLEIEEQSPSIDRV